MEGRNRWWPGSGFRFSWMIWVFDMDFFVGGCGFGYGCWFDNGWWFSGGWWSCGGGGWFDGVFGYMYILRGFKKLVITFFK